MADQRILGDNEVIELENTLALRPIYGACCMLTALYLEWPQCVGCEGRYSVTGIYLYIKRCNVCFKKRVVFLCQSCIYIYTSTLIHYIYIYIIYISGDAECLCLKGTFQGLKAPQDPESHDWCTVLNCRFIGKNVETFCKSKNQCFCCVTRAALPCDDDVPCMCNLYGLTLNFKNKCMCDCCSTMEALTMKGEGGELRLKGQDQVDQKRSAVSAQSGVQQ